MDDEKQKRTASPQAGPDEQLTPRFLLPGFSLDELEDLRIDARGKIAFLQEFGGALKHARHVGFMVETLAQRADLAEAERLWRTSQEAAEGTRPAWYPRHLNPLLAAEIVRRLPLPAFLADHAEYGEGMFQPVLSGLRSPCPLVEHDPKNARFFHRPDAGTWACLDCRLAGDTFGLAHRLLGLGGDALLDALLQEAGLPPRVEQ